MFVKAVAACAGALIIGLGADWLRRRQEQSEGLLAVIATLFIAAEFALTFGWPVPTILLWAIVAGAATVLSFAQLETVSAAVMANQYGQLIDRTRLAPK